MKLDYRQRIAEYIDAVLTGTRPAGHYEIAAVQRHLRDLERQRTEDFPYWFDEAEGIKRCNFYAKLRHCKGELAGRPIILEGWEAFNIASIFGWKRTDNNYRRFLRADMETARKNGKTTLAAGIGIEMMSQLENEPGAEVYAAAVDRNQAKLCWDGAKQIIQSSTELSEIFKCFQFSIVDMRMASSFKPLSKDTQNKDGLNPSCGICDERHAWKNNDIYELLRTGMGSRRQPLLFSITTAGLDKSLPYFEDLQRMKGILDGLVVDEQQYVMIYELDKDDDWKDERNWCKANPNLGVSLSLDYLRSEFQDAVRKGGAREVHFKTKNLNMWVDAPQVWIAEEKVRACNFGTDPESLLGCECYGGLDFASHVDIIAFELYFPTLPNKPVKSFFWIPEVKLEQSSDVVDYRAWKEQGWLKTTEGEVIDIEYLVADILDICRQYHVKNIAFDPYKAYHGLIQGLQQGGLDSILSEFSQGMKNMSEPTKELERLVTAGEIDLLGNPVLEWMFRNCTPYYDPNDNVKLFKGKARNKIDGVIALINAIGGYMAISVNNKPAYQTHTLRII